MQRRLVVSMVLMVVFAVLVSGLVSLFVAQRATIDQTRRQLTGEATSLARSVAPDNGSPVRLQRILTTLAPSLRLDGATVVGVRPDGKLVGLAGSKASLPSGVTAADIHPAQLYQLRSVSGYRGDLVYAAVPFPAVVVGGGIQRQVVGAIVLSSHPASAIQTAGPWFLVSAVVIVVLAGLTASRLSRRFLAPVRATQAVAGRIAAGDLDVRVPDPPGTEPELAALARSFNTMAESLARAKAAERHFLQSVSHDLRTPLTSIRGFAEAIEDGATEDAVAAARVIASEARRLERLVADLLALATLEARRFTLQMQPVSLHDAALRGVAGFVPAARDLGVELSVSPDRGIWVWADPDRLAQVIANLVENALRYARRAVTVSTSPGPAGAELWVVDDGPGIAGEDLPRIFDRLYGGRRHPDGAQPGRPMGSGLGLTIVSELVAAMGGSARAESPVSAEGGTRMVVTLAATGPPPAAR